MRMKLLTAALLSVLSLSGCSDDNNDGASTALQAIEFTATPAPATADERSKTYTQSLARLTYADGRVVEAPLSYNVLFSVKDPIAEVNGKKYAAGQLYNYRMEPLLDPMGNPVVAETPDANSLLKIDSRLFLVSHYEYDWILSDGSVAYTAPGWYTRMPMSMTLSEIAQASNGKLSATQVRPIDFSSVNGLWIPCAGSQTPWNTHLGSEEDYDLIYNPLDSKNYGTTTAGLKALGELYFKGERQAKPYHYGIIPEVTVKADGSTDVVKHYAMARGTWEMAKIMPDQRTAYLGDDGAYVQMTLFVADKAGDLSAGTVYTAKWNQTSDQGGGRANLSWIKLGHGTDAEIQALAETLSFSDIFEAAAPNSGSCAAGFTRVRAGSAADECLRLKPGMEKAAASRRCSVAPPSGPRWKASRSTPRIKSCIWPCRASRAVCAPTPPNRPIISAWRRTRPVPPIRWICSQASRIPRVTPSIPTGWRSACTLSRRCWASQSVLMPQAIPLM